MMLIQLRAILEILRFYCGQYWIHRPTVEPEMEQQFTICLPNFQFHIACESSQESSTQRWRCVCLSCVRLILRASEITMIQCNCVGAINESPTTEKAPKCAGCEHTRCALCTDSPSQTFILPVITRPHQWECVSCSQSYKKEGLTSIKCSCAEINPLSISPACVACAHRRCSRCSYR